MARPLGNQNPLLPPTALGLGQYQPNLQFLVPLGSQSLTILNPALFRRELPGSTTQSFVDSFLPETDLVDDPDLSHNIDLNPSLSSNSLIRQQSMIGRTGDDRFQARDHHGQVQRQPVDSSPDQSDIYQSETINDSVVTTPLDSPQTGAGLRSRAAAEKSASQTSLPLDETASEATEATVDISAEIPTEITSSETTRHAPSETTTDNLPSEETDDLPSAITATDRQDIQRRPNQLSNLTQLGHPDLPLTEPSPETPPAILPKISPEILLDSPVLDVDKASRVNDEVSDRLVPSASTVHPLPDDKTLANIMSLVDVSPQSPTGNTSEIDSPPVPITEQTTQEQDGIPQTAQLETSLDSILQPRSSSPHPSPSPLPREQSQSSADPQIEPTPDTDPDPERVEIAPEKTSENAPGDLRQSSSEELPLIHPDSQLSTPIQSESPARDRLSTSAHSKRRDREKPDRERREGIETDRRVNLRATQTPLQSPEKVLIQPSRDSSPNASKKLFRNLPESPSAQKNSRFPTLPRVIKPIGTLEPLGHNTSLGQTPLGQTPSGQISLKLKSQQPTEKKLLQARHGSEATMFEESSSQTALTQPGQSFAQNAQSILNPPEYSPTSPHQDVFTSTGSRYISALSPSLSQTSNPSIIRAKALDNGWQSLTDLISFTPKDGPSGSTVATPTMPMSSTGLPSGLSTQLQPGTSTLPRTSSDSPHPQTQNVISPQPDHVIAPSLDPHPYPNLHPLQPKLDSQKNTHQSLAQVAIPRTEPIPDQPEASPKQSLPSETTASPDTLDKLATHIYQLVRQRLITSQERRGHYTRRLG